MNHLQKRSSLFRYVLLQDLGRSVCSLRFLFGIFSILIWMIVNIGYEFLYYDYALESGSVYLLRMALDGSNMGPVLLVIATIPYATTFLSEEECGFQMEMIKRTGIYRYCISKVIATILSAFLLAAASILLFLVLLTFLHIPHVLPDESMAIYYEELCITKGVGWYYGLKIILTGLVCSLSAIFTLFISGYIPNAYAAILSPMIGYYLWNSILSLFSPLLPASIIWQMISPLNLFFAQVWLGNSLLSFLWTALFLTLLTAFLGIHFVRKACMGGTQ